MRKLLLTLLILSVSVAFIAAASSIDQTTITSGAGTDASINVKLDLQNAESFKLGFSDSEEHDTADVYGDPDGLKLSIDGTFATNKKSGEEKPLYIWWDITATQNYTVTLSVDGELKNGAGTADADKINWSVSGSGDETPVAIDTLNSTNSTTVIDFNGASTLTSKTGEQELTIKTASLDGKTKGEFSAQLILNIKAE